MNRTYKYLKKDIDELIKLNHLYVEYNPLVALQPKKGVLSDIIEKQTDILYLISELLEKKALDHEE